MENKVTEDSQIKAITVSEVMQELYSKNYFENAIVELLADVKNTLSYKRLKEVTTSHLSNILVEPTIRVPGKEDREAKMKQMAEIGLLTLSIDSSISEVVASKLQSDAFITIENTIHTLFARKTAEIEKSKTKSTPKLIVPIPREMQQLAESELNRVSYESAPKRRRTPNMKYMSEEYISEEYNSED